MLKTLLFILLFVYSIQIKAQFLSGDAGISSTGTLIGRPRPVTENRDYFKLISSFSSDNDKTKVFTQQLEFNHIFFRPIGRYLFTHKLQAKISHLNFINGSSIENVGVGDVFLSYSLDMFNDLPGAGGIGFVGGIKLATNNANNGLPMIFQTSLGSHDLLLGAFLTGYKWSYTIGYQQPIIHINENNYYGNSFIGNNYIRSGNLRRKGDLMVKVERRFGFKRFFLTVGAVPFFHLGNDIITNPTTNKQEEVIYNEKVSLNLTSKVYYLFLNKQELILSFGTPVIGREQRADGLSRIYSLTLSFFHYLKKEK